MEGLELNIPGPLLEHVHHQLQVVGTGDVLGHDGEVVPVQQQLSKQLQGLSPRHVVLRVQQLLVVLVKHALIVLLQELRAEHLVFGQQLL